MPATAKWFEIKNEAAKKSAEILIYGDIVSNKWLDEDVSAADFLNALKDIPLDYEIHVRINSRGGNVWGGAAIYQSLDNRGNKVTCYVDGVAASIAAVIACAGGKTVCNRGGLLMIHPPSALPMDSLNAAQCRDLATKLDKHAEAIAAILAKKTGKTQQEMLAKMNEGETWFTATEAKDFGLVDEISGDDATDFLNKAKAFDFSNFGKVPETLQSKTVGDKTQNTMNKTQIIAFLKENGITVAADASDEVINNALSQVTAKLKAAPAAGSTGNVDNAAMQRQLDTIKAQLDAERKQRITNVVVSLVGECRVSAAEQEKAITRAIADETYLDELRARPQVLAGAAPLDGGPAVYTKDDSVRNALKDIFDKGVCNKGGERAFDTAVDRSRVVQQIYANERSKIMAVMNAASNNSIDAGLKRVLILQETVRDFAIRVLPLRLFSTVFGNVPLQGTDTAVITYFPLRGLASQDFTDGDGTGGTGYQFGRGTSTASKIIPVDKRKYQEIDYSSKDFRRQPYFDALRLGRIAAEQLGVDILLDCLSIFTPGNFPTVPQADPNFNPNLNLPAAGYDSNQVKDLETVATNLNWPDGGRSFIAGTTLDNILAKDPTYKLALNIGTTSVVQEAKFPKLSGFDYAKMPNFPANGCNLQGLIAFASAMAAAFAPIDPAAGVRQQLVSYDIFTDDMTGISYNHRHWGLAQADRDFEVMESAYGKAPILAKAAQLLTHP